jgi:hypothetical protein
MYLLTIGLKRELVHLAFVGQVNRDEARRFRAEIETLVPTLSPGFQMLTDLSALDEMEYACADEIRAMMDQLKRSGVARIVRVIPDHRKDIGWTLMSHFHYGHDVSFQTFKTMAEALQALGT